MRVSFPRKRSLRITGGAICVFLLLIQPLRSVWMSLVMPQPWANTDAVHLYKVMTDYQNIPLDKAPLRKIQGFEEQTINPRQLNDYITGTDKDYPEFWSQYLAVQNRNKDNKDLKFSQRAELVELFQPLLNKTERARLLYAFETFHRACTKAGLTYFMIEASLMGVMRHHGLIPWDDDIDVAMSVKQWVQIRNVLGNIEGFELFPQRQNHWKFYASSGQHFENEYHAFPYLDIFFYDEDDSYVWAVSKYLKHDLVFQKDDIFPLKYRPFEGIMVPTPCNLDVVVRSSHDTNVCVTPAFIHKTNKKGLTSKTPYKCSDMYEFYPFVFPTGKVINGELEETLKVGSRVIHTVNVPVGC